MRSTPLLGCLLFLLINACGSDETPPIGGWQCDDATIEHGTQTVCAAQVPSFGGPVTRYTCVPVSSGADVVPRDLGGGTSDGTSSGTSGGTGDGASGGSGPVCPPGTTPGSGGGTGGGTSDGTGSGGSGTGGGSQCTPTAAGVQCTSTSCDKGYHASACGTCVPDGCSTCSCGTGGGSSDAGTGGCTLTQGYWKTHASAWPVSSLTLGGATYTEAQLLTILGTPPGGDASLILAHQLIATLLNAASGAGQAPIASVVAQAQAWLSANAGGKLLPYGVAASSPAGAQAVALSSQLDAYNNGAAGVAHCN